MTGERGHAACRVCGVWAEGVLTRRRTTLHAGVPTPADDYPVTVCPNCLALDPDRPGLAVRACLRAIGKRAEDDDLAAKAFADAGVDAVAVVYDPGAGVPGRGPYAQRKAFGHVDKDGKAAIRRGYARYLEMRVDASAEALTDRRTPPPPESPQGCLMCGVGLSLSWRPALTKALTPSPEYVDGHVCDACAAAVDRVGAFGHRAVLLACMEHRGQGDAVSDFVLDGHGVTATGLVAWAATGLPPGEPWAWVGEISLPGEEGEADPLLVLQAEVAALRAEVAALREAAAS